MKKILLALLVLAVLGVGVFCTLEKENNDYIRIHIRANSNEEIDQNIKMVVKEKIVNALIPILAKAENKNEAKLLLQHNLDRLASIADDVLENNSFEYGAKAELTREEFPARKYGDLVLEKGEYDALIINLGEGAGDNWWCVAFPPLCFVPTEGANIKYKSKIIEIIEKFKEKVAKSS